MIGCVRVPYFAAQVTVQARPMLAGRPFALVEPEEPERVAAISAGAARWGVLGGMRTGEALGWCPDLAVVPTSALLQHQAQDGLLDLLAELTPRVELENTVRRYKGRGRRPRQVSMPQASDDALVVYFDPGRLTGAQGRALGDQLVEHIGRMVGLEARVGLSGARFTAHAAALEADPVRVVAPRQSADFLAPFPLALLPADAETLRQLGLLGLRTLGQVAALPAAAVEARFGRNGRFLQRLAAGEDPRRVRTYQPRITVQAQALLDDPLTQRQQLEAQVQRLAEEAAAQLSAQQRVTRDLALHLDLDDGSHLERTLVPRQPLSTMRVADAACELLSVLHPHTGVHGVTVALTGIEPPAARQLPLFERNPVAVERLRAVVGHLAPRYGPGTFVRAVVVDAEARHPARRVRWETVA